MKLQSKRFETTRLRRGLLSTVLWRGAGVLLLSTIVAGVVSCRSRGSTFAAIDPGGIGGSSFENDFRSFMFEIPPFFFQGVRVATVEPEEQGQAVAPENVRERTVDEYVAAFNEFFAMNATKQFDNIFLGFFSRFHAVKVTRLLGVSFNENMLIDLVVVEKKGGKIQRGSNLSAAERTAVSSLGDADGWHAYFLVPVPEQGQLTSMEIMDLSLQFLAIFGSNLGSHMRGLDTFRAGVVDPQYKLYYNWMETRTNVNAGHFSSEQAFFERYQELLTAIIDHAGFYLKPGLLEKGEFEKHFLARRKAVGDHLKVVSQLAREQRAKLAAENADRSASLARRKMVLDKSSFQADTLALESSPESLANRRAVAAIMSTYMPWWEYTPVEKMYWLSVLEAIRNPVPVAKRLITLRGIDFQNKTEKQPDSDVEIEFAKKINTNQNSVNHAFRGLSTIRDPQPQKPDGDGFIPFGGRATAWPGFGSDRARIIGHEPRIGQMLANHSQNPQGSFVLSSTLQPDTAEAFGGKAVLWLLADPRRVWPAALTTFESEDEFLTPVLYFPDEIIKVHPTPGGGGFDGGEIPDGPLGKALSVDGLRVAAGPGFEPGILPFPGEGGQASFSVADDVIPAVLEKFPGVTFENLNPDVFSDANEEFMFDRYFEILDLAAIGALPDQVDTPIPHVDKILNHPAIRDLNSGAIKKENVEAVERELKLTRPDLTGFKD